MTRRLLDATPHDFAQMDGAALQASIRAADGRTLAVEVICTVDPPVEGITQGELAAAMGADVIVLDRYDPLRPRIAGAPENDRSDRAPLAAYKHLLGRPLGINLIVVGDSAGKDLGGRTAQKPHIDLAVEQGVDCLFLYARPGMGGTLERQVETAAAVRRDHGRRVLLIGVPTFSAAPPRTDDALTRYCDSAARLVEAGCDGIGLPMPATKSGWTVDAAASIVDQVHRAGGLAWLFVTGSIEGAPQDVMFTLALTAKQIGADAVRLDEAGLSGMPVPENILAFSLAFRGRAHTFRRMASARR
jgi:hypothetical protein